MSESTRGAFITFEGGEGTGKTTQALALVCFLKEHGYDAVYTREPGGTPIASVIRSLIMLDPRVISVLSAIGNEDGEELLEDLVPADIPPETELLLLLAARAQHVAHINQLMERGCIVVCDRFSASTFAYQVVARGMHQESVERLEEAIRAGLSPDLTLWFDIPVEKGLQRRNHAAGKGGEFNRFDAQALAFHERVRSGFARWAETHPEVMRIDADQSIERLAADVRRIVLGQLGIVFQQQVLPFDE